MMKVTYHADGYGPARAAINVKVHAAGVDFWPDEIDVLGEDRAAEIVSRAYDEIAAEFWDAAANVARGLGLGEIEQSGRSGGWLVLTRESFDLEAIGAADRTPDHGPQFMEGYRKLTEWAKAYIGNARSLVRSRARSLAIDEIGANAAARMFSKVQS